MLKDSVIARELASLDPELEAVISEHMKDYDEILEHVLLGDVTRYILDLYQKDPDSPLVKKTVGTLSRTFSEGGTDIQELVSVSFLENLIGSDALDQGFMFLLGAELRQELERYGR